MNFVFGSSIMIISAGKHGMRAKPLPFWHPTLKSCACLCRKMAFSVVVRSNDNVRTFRTYVNKIWMQNCVCVCLVGCLGFDETIIMNMLSHFVYRMCCDDLQTSINTPRIQDTEPKIWYKMYQHGTASTFIIHFALDETKRTHTHICTICWTKLAESRSASLKSRYIYMSQRVDTWDCLVYFIHQHLNWEKAGASQQNTYKFVQYSLVIRQSLLKSNLIQWEMRKSALSNEQIVQTQNRRT